VEPKEFDEILLDVAYQTFAVKTSYFDRLGQKIWANAGVENWVQVELILAFLIRNIPVTTIGKRKRGCDLIINGNAVELRCATTPNSSWLLDAIKKHPKAELYLFLSQTNSKLLNELETYFEKNGYIGKYKMLNEKWLVMVVKRNAEIALSSAEKVSLVHAETKIEMLQPKTRRTPKPEWTMDDFLEKLNMVSPELRTKFYRIKKVIESLWGNRVRLKFPYRNVVDFRIPPPTGTVVSLGIQTRRNRFELYLKFGNEKPDDPKKITEDVTRFGFGKLNRRLYFEPQDKVGALDERGSIANLLKQVHRLNP